MNIAPWRMKLVTAIITRTKTVHSTQRYEFEACKDSLFELVEIDKGRPVPERVSANWFINEFHATDRAIKVLMTQVQQEWDNVEVDYSQVAPQPVYLPEKKLINAVDSMLEKMTPLDEYESEDNQEYMECVISVKLKAGKIINQELTNYLQSRETLKSYLFKIRKQVCATGQWIDLWFAYNQGLAKIYDALCQHSDIEQVLTKPLADYGRKTSAYNA